MTEPPPVAAAQVGGSELDPGNAPQGVRPGDNGSPAGGLGPPNLERQIAAYLHVTRHDPRYSDDGIAQGVLDLVDSVEGPG
jgi:hypothetical protein